MEARQEPLPLVNKVYFSMRTRPRRSSI
jgi:hypothetical protein